jgi:excisionase family DNA binding protein
MLSIGAAASMLGVCVKTLRRWDAKGKIRCHRTVGNHRRFPLQEVHRLLGKEVPEGREPGGHETCAIYARVSSHEQKKRGDLDAQVQALKTHCKRQKMEVSGTCTDLGSGLNPTRKGSWLLVRDAKRGKFQQVVVNYKDRLTGFGFRYISELLKAHGVKVIAFHGLKAKTLETELVEDLVSIIQSFSGRLYGMRSHQNKKKALS